MRSKVITIEGKELSITYTVDVWDIHEVWYEGVNITPFIIDDWNEKIYEVLEGMEE